MARSSRERKAWEGTQLDMLLNEVFIDYTMTRVFPRILRIDENPVCPSQVVALTFCVRYCSWA